MVYEVKDIRLQQLLDTKRAALTPCGTIRLEKNDPQTESNRAFGI